MKTAVVTIVIGEDYTRKFNEIFRTATEMYCARYGYEFIMVTSSLLPKEYTSNKTMTMHKHAVAYHKDFQTYDRIAIIDADILVTPQCPPIHELELGVKIGVVDEYCQPTLEKRKEVQRMNGFETTAKEYYMKFLNIPYETNSVINGGFIICSPVYHADFFRNYMNTYLDTVKNSSVDPYHKEQASFGYEVMKANKHMVLDGKWDFIWPVCRDVAVNMDKEYANKYDYHQVVYESAYMIHYCSNQDYDLARDAGK
jgi:hypothetical protein